MAHERRAALKAQVPEDNDEARVLGEAAEMLRAVADRLPNCSRWRDSFAKIADGFEAGAMLSQMVERHCPRSTPG